MSPAVFRGGLAAPFSAGSYFHHVRRDLLSKSERRRQRGAVQAEEPMTAHVRGSDGSVRPFVVGKTESAEGMRRVAGKMMQKCTLRQNLQNFNTIRPPNA